MCACVYILCAFGSPPVMSVENVAEAKPNECCMLREGEREIERERERERASEREREREGERGGWERERRERMSKRDTVWQR
jgi:hypothetical protein